MRGWGRSTLTFEFVLLSLCCPSLFFVRSLLSIPLRLEHYPGLLVSKERGRADVIQKKVYALRGAVHLTPATGASHSSWHGQSNSRETQEAVSSPPRSCQIRVARNVDKGQAILTGAFGRGHGGNIGDTTARAVERAGATR